MPKATTGGAPKKFSLQTLPGGFVTLRPLSYGELLTRREMGTKLLGDMGSSKIEVDTLQQLARAYDFEHCIADHNLYADDAETEKLDFSNALTLTLLDPQIGQEIERLIDKLNEVAELGNSNPSSIPSVEDKTGTTTPTTEKTSS